MVAEDNKQKIRLNWKSKVELKTCICAAMVDAEVGSRVKLKTEN